MRNYHNSDPWAKVADSANNAMFKYLVNRPNPADLEYKNAVAEKTRLEAQQLQNQMAAPGRLGSTFAEIYSPQIERPTEDFIGPMGQFPGGVVPPDVEQQRFQERKPQMFADAMQFAGDKPGSLGDIFLAFAANAGATPEQVSRAQLGAKVGYGSTREGVMEKPFSLSPGSIRYDSKGNRIAAAPFKPGGSGPSFRMLPDGTVEFGADGLSPTNSIKTDLQKQQISNAKLKGLLDYNRELAKKDPTNFGVPGFVKGKIQDVTALSQGVSQAMGYKDIKSAALDVQKMAMRNKIDPSLFSGVFDPNLPALETASDLLVFQAADALASQSGRSMSNEDVKHFKNIVGSPRDLFGNQQKYLSKLNTIESLLGLNEDVVDNTAGGNITKRFPSSTNNVKPVNDTSANGWSEEDEARLQELEEMYGGQ
jgi:hypothetical protein